MAEDLRRFLADEPIRARRASAAERSARWARHHPGMATLGAVLTAVLVMATVASLIAASRFREQWLRAELKSLEANEKSLEANEKSLEANEKTRALERQLYIHRVNLAQREAVTDIAEAKRFLDQCPLTLRGWEWNYIERSCHLERRTLRGHTHSVNTVAFSPDGRLVVSGAGERFYGASETHNAELILWDARSGRRVCSVPGLKGAINTVAFSPDGKSIVVGSGYHRGPMSPEGHLSLWDLATGNRLYDRVETGHNLLSVAFSPDGRLIAAGYGEYSSKGAGLLKLWDARDGKETLAVPSPPGGVNSVAFSPDSRRVALACSEIVEIWDVEPPRKVRELRGHTSWVYCVVFSPDGLHLATGGWDKSFKNWDLATGTPLFTGEGHNSFVTGLVFSPDGKRLVTASEDRTVRGWDAASGHSLFTLRGHDAGGITGLAFSPDGTSIASSGEDQTVKLWDATTEYPITFRDHKGWVTSIAFSLDGQRVVSGSGDRKLMLWDPTVGRRLDMLQGQGEWINDVAYSPDGRFIASCALDGRIPLWDVAARRICQTLVLSENLPQCLAFSPDGHRLAAGSGAPNTTMDQVGIVRVWAIPEGRELLTYRGHAGGIFHLAFGPDGKTIASVGGDLRRHTGEVKLWDAATGHDLRSFGDHADIIRRGVAFSPDGTLLATASRDTTAKLWDVAAGRLLHTLKHTNSVDCLAFNRDGTRLATGSDDSTIKLWNVATGDEVITLRGHSAGINSVVFSPDGHRLVSGSIDWTARVWDARPLDLSDGSSPIADQ
jgi:WD40 repeat protein